MEVIRIKNLQYDCAALDWVGDKLVDWTSNRTFYSKSGEEFSLNKYLFGERFNGVKSLKDGEFVVLYERLGTKGLLLKNGELVREINRSYYCSTVYEYPVELIIYKEEIYLIHCPEHFNEIQIEEFESGKRLLKQNADELEDVFYSRLEVSPSGKYLLSSGWVWHPFDILSIFRFDNVIETKTLSKDIYDKFWTAEITSARFITDEKILVTSGFEESLSDVEEGDLIPGKFGVYNIETNSYETLFDHVEPMGNVYPINEELAWDIYKYPKIVNLKTGKVIDREKSIDSGEQNSSIIHHLDNLPHISFSEDRRQVAIGRGREIVILRI